MTKAFSGWLAVVSSTCTHLYTWYIGRASFGQSDVHLLLQKPGRPGVALCSVLFYGNVALCCVAFGRPAVYLTEGKYENVSPHSDAMPIHYPTLHPYIYIYIYTHAFMYTLNKVGCLAPCHTWSHTRTIPLHQWCHQREHILRCCHYCC